MPANAEDRLLEELRHHAVSLAPGSRLPSVREISKRHHVSPGTVTGAIARLTLEGLAVAHPGRGTYVAERAADAPAPDFGWQSLALDFGRDGVGDLDRLLAPVPDNTFGLSSGFPSEDLLPLNLLATAASRAARRPGAWTRTAPEGIPELRTWFARQVGPSTDPGDVLVTSGAQAALATLMRAFGAPGDPIIVESPTYIGALAAARNAGLTPIPVSADADGIRTDLLAQALERTRARLIYTQPLFSNPHGGSLSAERRGELLGLAESHGAFVIEDDYVRDLWLDREPPLPPLASEDPNGHVIYVRSPTKATAASLRIAGVVARGPAYQRLRSARMVDDFFVSAAIQHTAVELLTSPAWQRHLRQLRRTLGSRRDALVGALANELPEWQLAIRTQGGLCLWLQLPRGTDEGDTVQAAAAAGVQIMPGAPWFPAEPPAPHVRLSFAAETEPRLTEAVTVLARALRPYS